MLIKHLVANLGSDVSRALGCTTVRVEYHLTLGIFDDPTSFMRAFPPNTWHTPHQISSGSDCIARKLTEKEPPCQCSEYEGVHEDCEQVAGDESLMTVLASAYGTSPKPLLSRVLRHPWSYRIYRLEHFPHNPPILLVTARVFRTAHKPLQLISNEIMAAACIFCKIIKGHHPLRLD